jgi:hypothetical protein
MARWPVAGLVAGLAALSAASTCAGDNVRLRSGAMRGTVERVLAGASRRLERPACSAVLDDFRDADGRPLRQRLQATGSDASRYLDRVLFYDGYRNGRCATQGVFAATQPNSAVVLVCARFYEQAGHDPNLAEMVLIHEALHTLGLGEDPPTSAAITAQVLKRCR